MIVHFLDTVLLLDLYLCLGSPESHWNPPCEVSPDCSSFVQPLQSFSFPAGVPWKPRIMVLWGKARDKQQWIWHWRPELLDCTVTGVHIHNSILFNSAHQGRGWVAFLYEKNAVFWKEFCSTTQHCWVCREIKLYLSQMSTGYLFSPSPTS